jgi:hypothetical protein
MKACSTETYQGPINRKEWDQIRNYKGRVSDLKQQINVQTGSFPPGETPKKDATLGLTAGYDTFSPATNER